VASGNDLGSEARIASLIRNLGRGSPNKYLNHPNIEEMRSARCHSLFLVDDFIGSGERTTQFWSSMWLNSTIRSWRSLQLIKTHAIAYSATLEGRRTVERARGKPEVNVERDCPTFYRMPWPSVDRREILDLIETYGHRTSMPMHANGYGGHATALVFEHGCPDNCPAILWAPPASGSNWLPLFPRRSVSPSDASAFPNEIARRDPVLVMTQAGQQRLAASGALAMRGPIGPTLLVVMGLAGKGVRSRAALGYATGLSAFRCAEILDRCVQWGLLTRTLRLTPEGAAELDSARRSGVLPTAIPSRGSESYYPQQLRRPVDG
jgi:hypothetical protein